VAPVDGGRMPGRSPGQLRSARPCRLLVVTAVLLLAACTSPPATRPGQPPAAAVTSSPTTRAAAPPGSLANPRRLDCHNRNVWVPGEDKQPYRPGRADLAVGSLLIPGLRSWAHARPDSLGQDHQFKVGVQVRRGQTATLVIPAAFHQVAGLLYAQQARSAQTPAQADQAVTFTACADHHTPFVGGFFVLEPRCVPLEIRPAGGRPLREVISFFAGHC
jgi:hypothetical protein